MSVRLMHITCPNCGLVEDLFPLDGVIAVEYSRCHQANLVPENAPKITGKCRCGRALDDHKGLRPCP